MRQVVAAAALLALVSSLGSAFQGSGPDSRVVRMQTLNVRDILYVLTGGSNTLALMRDDGVLLVDTKPPGWEQGHPRRHPGRHRQAGDHIINTHAHEDHVGGNSAFPAATRLSRTRTPGRAWRRWPPSADRTPKCLPNQPVTDRLSLLSGEDRIELYYFGRGHTDGDLVVVFPEKRLAHFGDLFPAKAAPVIDTASGGSGVAFPDTLAKAVAEIKNVEPGDHRAR